MMGLGRLSAWLVASLVYFSLGCAAPTAKVLKTEAFTPGQKLVVLPVLGPADISSIVTSAVEKQLTATGHTFVTAQQVRESLVEQNLLDKYQSFIEKQNSLGIVDPTFLKNLEGLGHHFMIVKVTDWAQGGNFLAESFTKSQFQQTLEASATKVRSGETLVGLNASVYSATGDLIYHDTSEGRLSNPFKPPPFQQIAEMAAWKLAHTLPK